MGRNFDLSLQKHFSGPPYDPLQADYKFEQNGFIPKGILRGTALGTPRTGFQTVWMTITMVMMMTMMRNHHKGGCACIRLFWTAMNSNKGYDKGLGWDQKRERASVQGLVEDIAKQGSERIVWNELFLAARWLSGSWLLMFDFLVSIQVSQGSAFFLISVVFV